MKTSLARGGVIAALAALCILGALGFPGRGGILAPLRADSTVLTLTGMVKAAPRDAPLAGATVYSDKELCLTDERGFFRLGSGKGAEVRIEAPGYEPLRLRPTSEQPLIILLFPVQQPQDPSD